MRNIIRQPVMLRRAIILVIATLIATSSLAQLKPDNFTQYTEQVGLPGSQVNTVIQDKFRNYWVGTSNHLKITKQNNESKINQRKFS